MTPFCGRWKRARGGWIRVCRLGEVRTALRVDERVVGSMEAAGMGPIMLRRRFATAAEARRALDRALALTVRMHVGGRG